MSQRLCLARPGERCGADQVLSHARPGSVWPAVIDHIRAQGVIAMEIWQRGDRLLMVDVTTIREAFVRARLAQSAKWRH